MSYVLITPARNEEAFIEKTIESVVQQSHRPLKWIIVNDGSVDATGKIVAGCAAKFDWIEVVTLPTHRDRTFAGKVHAFNAGFERVRQMKFEVVGNLDADISFDADYFKFLMSKFEEDSGLGVAGTIFCSEGYSSGKDSFEGQNHVAGGVQLFRRRCFQDIVVPFSMTIHKDYGILWEHLVLDEIQAQLQSRQIFYWRDKRGHEVDFILRKRPDEPTAIECKWSAKDFDPVNLRFFRKHYPQGENLVLARDVDRPYQREYQGLRVKILGAKELISLLLSQEGKRGS